jgi:hypothetical protein
MLQNMSKILAIIAVLVIASGIVITQTVEATTIINNPGECINFANNKQISKELGNFSDYSRQCAKAFGGK